MKHILFLCHRIPYPPNKGDKIRSYNVLIHLLKNNKVSIGFLVDEPSDLKYVEKLRQLTENVFFDQINSKLKKIKSTATSFLQGAPISVPYFYSSNLQNDLDNFLDTNAIDTVICSSSPSAEYIFRSRHHDHLTNNVHLVMDFIDMDSQKWAQYAEREGFPLKFIYNREARYLLNYERRIEKEFEQLFIVSEAEKELFQSLVPTDKLHAISNGVDLEFFNPEHSSKPILNAPSLVFTGAMDYWPNVDGAIWFVEKVLPEIKIKFPDITFYLVGSNPSQELKQFDNRKDIIVTGFVDDIRDYIQQANVCVIPLRIARGIQNKVLEAMAMGKAVVSTPEAAEGIHINMDSDISIHKDEISFAEAVIDLLNNKEKTLQLGNNARKAVEDNYSWEHNLKMLDDII